MNAVCSMDYYFGLVLKRTDLYIDLENERNAELDVIGICTDAPFSELQSAVRIDRCAVDHG